MTDGNLQEFGDYDVVVVGAGAAGIAAAIAAGRTGARVVLVERAGSVGGISATLPWLGFHDQEYHQVVRGLATEFVERLQAVGGAGPITLDPKCGSLVSIHGHHWKTVAFDLLTEAGVTVLLHTLVVDALRDDDRVTGIVVESKSGRGALHGSVIIDCSGDGDVAAVAGASWEKGRTEDGMVQAPTLVFRLGGIDNAAFRAACQDSENRYREWLVPYPDLFELMARKLHEVDTFVLGGFADLIARARQDGTVDFPQTRIVGVKVHTDEAPDELSVVMTRVLGLDPTDMASLSDATVRVHAQVPDLIRFFRTYVPGCENARLVEIAPMLGVRESRRIMGDTVLTANDLVTGARHADDVAMGGYHIDIHRPSGSWVQSTNVKAYGIPLGCLIAAGLDGLMMAGKCISATHEAIGSSRVIPICIAEGQAAGTAAGLAALACVSVRDLSVQRVREALLAAGAELGVEPLSVDPNSAGWPVLPFDEVETTGEGDFTTSAAWIGRT